MRSSRPLVRRAVLLVAAGLLASPALLPVAPALADETPSPRPAPTSGPKDAKDLKTFGIGPANRAGLDGRAAFVYSGKPGTVVRDRVALLNYSFRPVKVRMYAADAFTNDTGAFDVLPAGSKSTDVGAWTNLKPRIVTIPARSRAAAAPPAQKIVPFTIRVPKKATPGDHAGGIVLSSVTNAPRAGVSAVVVDRRVGTRVYVRVPGELEPRLEIQDLTASYNQNWNPFGRGSVDTTYRVVNTGNVALSADQVVRLVGWFGASAQGPALDDLQQVLPGDSVQVSARIDGVLPTFRGTDVVELTPYAGTEEAGKEPFPQVTASVSVWLVPWAFLVLVAALVIGGLLAWRWWRRRTDPSAADDPDSDLSSQELVNA
jgi:hypothetical protein